MATVTIQQNIGGYTGSLDSFLREGRPDNSYKTATVISVDGADNTNMQIQGLLSFSGIFGDGPGLIPLGATITSASLMLSLSDATKSPVSFYRMAQDWAALPTLTWNSFGGGIQTNGSEALSTADLSLSGLASGIQSIDVTQSLQAWSDGAANYGWMLSSGGSDGFAFSSSEGLTAPILTVTYEFLPIPVPGLTVVQSGGTTLVNEGGAGDTFSIALQSAPMSDVTIAISTSGPGDIGITTALLTFTPQNWQAPQSVALDAINDNLIEGPETFNVTLTTTSTDPGYNGLSSSVTVAVNDNDVAQPLLSPAVVAIHNSWPYGAGDPSGIAYVPGLDLLFISDSEHDEAPYNSPINLFATRLDGTFVDSFSMRSFTREPTGLAYNPFNGLLYISDDDADKIFIVNPLDPTTKIGEINLKPLSIKDAEDPVIDTVTGHIFMLDGATRSFIELTATGVLVDKTVLSTEIKDPEALAYDSANDVFYMAGGATRGTIFQTDRDGQILASFDLLNAYTSPITGGRPKIKGLEIAPSSDPNDGNRMSLFATDYGVDQSPDGRVIEVDLHYGWLVA
jgi:hypothetical protein